MTDQKASVRDAYDAIAETHFEERADDPADAALLEELRERLPEGSRVLDAGCGQGTPVANRLSPEYDVVGLDFSAEQLRLAADVAPGAALFRGDMTDLAFEDEAFDAVCAFHSIIHVPIDEYPDVIGEFARVVRPGGLLLASTGPGEWRGSNPDWLDTGVEMEWSFPDPDEVRAMLEAGGARDAPDSRSDRAAGFEVLDRWIVTAGVEHDEDGEVFHSESIPDGEEVVGMHFFLARRR